MCCIKGACFLPRSGAECPLRLMLVSGREEPEGVYVDDEIVADEALASR